MIVAASSICALAWRTVRLMIAAGDVLSVTATQATAEKPRLPPSSSAAGLTRSQADRPPGPLAGYARGPADLAGAGTAYSQN
jgi:hypothetical protein